MTASTSFSLSMEPRDLLVGDLQLPSPPDIYFRVCRLMDDPESNSLQFSREIEKDPSLSARLLKIVNSPFYGFRSSVSSISRAVTLLGLRELRDLVLATTVVDAFAGLPTNLISMRGFWHDSVRCAVYARVLGARHRKRDQLEGLFVAGLLVQLGNLVIYRKVPELAREALMRHKLQGLPLHQAQHQVLGFDYCAVTAELLNKWHIPANVSEVVRFALTPDLAEEFKLETAVVHLALRLSTLASFDPNVVMPSLPSHAPAWERAGITPERIIDCLEQAQFDYDAMLRVFPRQIA